MAGRTSVSITPDQYANEWQQGMTQSVQKIQDGVMRVTDNPMAKAAAASDKYVQGTAAAVSSGRYQAGLMAVDFQQWKNITKQKVGERLSGGATAAKPKMVKFANYLLPAVSSAMQEVAQMPDNSLQDSINRMTKFVTLMASNPYKK